MEIFNIESQSLNLSTMTIPEGPVILDVGGGGEGVIARNFTANQVIAIDTLRSELEESQSPSVKLTMDARNTCFLDNSFSWATAFFFFMYVQNKSKAAVFGELFRVLKPGGELLIWDSNISLPSDYKNYDAIVVNLHITTLPGEEINTGYGVACEKDFKFSEDTLLNMAHDAGFEILERRPFAKTLFFSRLGKPG